ncbi:MAG: GNAT family N-acetyltransferase [Chloroflexi bacterium]|nr:GNAT family N-acetyltransferase [Chloroflexota bacterium]
MNLKKQPSSITIRHDLRPGDIGYLIYLHGILYAQEYGFDATFEPYVAGPMAEFCKSRTDRERLWIVEKDGQIVGSVAIVKFSKEQAQFRWLLLHPDTRGHGMGKALVQEAVQFCRDCGYSSVFLWTVSALNAAAKLYQSAGFRLTEEKTHEIWGVTLTEQRYDLELGD